MQGVNMSDRKATLLRDLQLQSMIGAEIGPLDRPLVSKAGASVFYVDHCDTAALKQKYAADSNVSIELLQVDAVWGELTLAQALQAADSISGLPSKGLDYVVASHVIEHVPDLVTWLQEVAETLSGTGVLRLAVPDKRFTFDFRRRISTLPEVADAFVRRRRVPGGSRILDFCMNMVTVDCAKAWRNELKQDELVRGYTDEDALGLARDAEQNGHYHDVHCWVFTPESFVDLMQDMARCGLVPLACEWLVETAYCDMEFFASLRPCDDPALAADSWQIARSRLSRTPENAASPGGEAVGPLRLADTKAAPSKAGRWKFWARG